MLRKSQLTKTRVVVQSNCDKHCGWKLVLLDNAWLTDTVCTLNRCQDRQVVFGNNFRRDGQVPDDAAINKVNSRVARGAVRLSRSIFMHTKMILAATMIGKLASDEVREVEMGVAV